MNTPNQDMQIELPRLNGPGLKYLLPGLLALALLISSWARIGPEEVGVVQRFGAYNRTLPSGLNFKLPYPIERVTKVPVERQLKEEFGFRTLVADVRTRYSQREYGSESLMMTGDLNLADVQWIVQFRITDPYLYLFKVRNVRKTLRDMTESIMREIVGDRSVNEVLTVGRQEIASEVEVRLQDLCNQYENGVHIEQLILQDVNPPNPVKPAFNEVNEAQQEREKLINEALADYNRVIPRARGEAEQKLQQAEGYRTERVNEAIGEAARFESVLAEYRKAPQVTRQRLYLETMESVLTASGSKLIVDENVENVLPVMLEAGKGLSIGGGK